jgi:hypothetical protein
MHMGEESKFELPGARNGIHVLDSGQAMTIQVGDATVGNADIGDVLDPGDSQMYQQQT